MDMLWLKVRKMGAWKSNKTKNMCLTIKKHKTE